MLADLNILEAIQFNFGMPTSIVRLQMGFVSLPFVFLCALFISVPGINGNLFNHGHFSFSGHKGLYSKPGVIANTDVKTEWFSQRLNHFDPSDTRQWQQRYFINDTFYKPGGPVFLLIDGESEANPAWIKNGHWISMAEKLGAYCIQIEHRFYGKSHPTPDASLSNLRYLTSEQALGDLAAFTAAMKLQKFPVKFILKTSNHEKKLLNKWVAIGGSYTGMLAAWFRFKYPHLVDIALASSAPVLVKVNYKEYFGVVSAVMHHTNAQCSRVVEEAVHTMQELLKRGPTGWAVIENTFHLCDQLIGTNQDDVSNLFSTIAGNWGFIVQYNNDNQEFVGSTTANITIQTLCDIMTQNTTGLSAIPKTPMQRYADVNTLIQNAFNESCTDFKYSEMINQFQQTHWNSPMVMDGSRQWAFQTCTEQVSFESSDLLDQPFGHEFPVEVSIKECEDLFGSKYNRDFIEKATHWTNAYYGAKNIKVTRVIFINGSIDPWNLLGLTAQNETTSDNLVIFIHGTAHCADMYPSSAKDPQQLRNARAQILQQITAWLQA